MSDVQVCCLWVTPRANRVLPSGEAPWWAEWGPTYVERLRAGVRRFGGGEALCLTDDPTIPEPTLKYEGPGRGWWAKLELFNPQYALRDILYLDLDNVICGPLQSLLDALGPLQMADDVIYPGLPNGSVIRAHAPFLRWAWEAWREDPVAIQQRFSVWPHASDQAYLADWYRRTQGKSVPLFDRKYLLNARHELERGIPVGPETCVVYGSWEPKPHRSTHPFYRAFWGDATLSPPRPESSGLARVL